MMVLSVVATLSQFSWGNLLRQVNPVNCRAHVSAVARTIFGKRRSPLCVPQVALAAQVRTLARRAQIFLCTCPGV